MKKKNYLEREELYKELLKWKESHPDIDQRIPSEQLGAMFIKICDHMLRMGSFNRYPEQVKQDMKSFALYKCIRGLKTFKFDEFAEQRCFNYFTRAIYLSFLTELSKHYKQINIKRDLTERYLNQLYCLNPSTAEKLLKENEFPNV